MTPTANITVYDVAGRAGVSIATVSRVVKEHPNVAAATRQRVQDAIEELGWRPSSTARALARQGHDAIGIVFPDLSGPYYSEVIRGFERTAGDRTAVHILATHGRPTAADQVRDLAERVDGLVLMGATADDDLVRDLRARDVPVVLLARPAVDDAPTIQSDNLGAARALADHLADHGHDRIAFLGDPGRSPDVLERFTGVRAALADHGVDLGEPILPSGFHVRDGREAFLRSWKDGRHPTAVVAANDQLAAGVHAAATIVGLTVGADLALTGWDDQDVAAVLSPPLTTVRQPMADLGRRAATTIFDVLAGATPEPVLLATELVVRASCGCDPGDAPTDPEHAPTDPPA